MIRTMRRSSILVCTLLLLASCTSQERGDRARGEDGSAQKKLFALLPPERTNIYFKNTLSAQPTPHKNELTYEYFSSGGGVAVGDLNGDGLDDIYFTANMSYNKLYLNKGNMVFEDVTRISGVAGRKNTWKTGVTMADVNGDGLLDIYVCYSGELPLERRVDELYINQGTDENGVPHFEEQASEYGLANPHSSTQAHFFDYDRDSDLDLFLLTHNVKSTPRQGSRGTRRRLEEEDPVNGVRFYENKGGHFEDVTERVGIRSSSLTYGLGAMVSDINKDGWPDIYVGNDYSPPDYLYINNGDGTFTNKIKSSIGHTSRASMGVDIADINNDGWSDIVVLDMLPEDNRRQKLLFMPNDRRSFKQNVQSGFHYQYMRNTLQLNNGNGTFSEIGQLAGISNTDWSWAPLVADYDNDGKNDLFVTNGILHDITNRDFLRYRVNYLIKNNYDLTPKDLLHLMEKLPSSDLTNYAFKNTGNLQFKDVSTAWGLARPLISNGAAYSDLDNDGDLDLVTNNVNDYASVFENRASEITGNNYLRIDLKGSGGNTYGIGSKITLYTNGTEQYKEQMPTRGYLSSVSPTLHFGLGRHTVVDSLRVIWPDGEVQILRGIKANQRLTLYQRDAAEVGGRAGGRSASDGTAAFEEVPSPVEFTHRMDGNVDDFLRQPLMVNPKSFAGPALAKADVNGDGRVDVFAGGGSGQAGMLYLQRPNGQFAPAPQPAFEEDSRSNDVDALFFDFNRDGHPDLYVASGGYDHFTPGDAALQDRLYLGDGSGNFTRAGDALPEMRTSTGAVAAADINGDGWPDLFVGGRVIPGQYPKPPRSYVLINDGQGHFEDRTAEIAPGLQRIGMVTDAHWHDLDGEGAEELIVAGEWMPIRVFENDEGILSDATESYFERPYSGLWNEILIDDLNRDGIPDLIAGNFGLNAQLVAGEDTPAELYYADFDGNGSVDPILTFYIQGVSYPYVLLDELRDQLPAIAAQFSSYESYAEATLDDLFTSEEIEEAGKLEARFLETSFFIGREGGGFEKKSLPVQAQFAPVFTITTLDYDGDGNKDILLCGNINEARIRFGKYDANYGVLLRGDGDGAFEYVPQYESGFNLQGDVRSALKVNNHFLFGINRGAIQAYQPADE